MEEYVTRAEFLEFKRQMEQKTEEIRTVRVEVASKDVIDCVNEVKQELTQELKTVSDTWLNTLQEHYTEHKQDIAAVRAEMATKDDLAKMKEDIIDAIRKYSQPGKN